MYKYWFADNESYGAQDLNKMVSRLVTSGVADPFTNGVPYNLSKVNSAGALLYTSGVVPETVHTLKVVSAGQNKVLIQPGTAFFSDGAVIEVEAGGHELETAPGAKHYVYLKNDLASANTCYPACTTNEPTGDFVMLAEVSAIGEITDKRVYCRGKLPGYASNAFNTLKITDTVKVTKNVAESEKVYNIGSGNYHFVMAVQYNPSGYVALGVKNLEDGSTLAFSGYRTNGHGEGEGRLCVRCDSYRWLYFTPEISGGKLTLSFAFRNDGTANYTDNVPITLYLF